MEIVRLGYVWQQELESIMRLRCHNRVKGEKVRTRLNNNIFSSSRAF